MYPKSWVKQAGAELQQTQPDPGLGFIFIDLSEYWHIKTNKRAEWYFSTLGPSLSFQSECYFSTLALSWSFQAGVHHYLCWAGVLYCIVLEIKI